MKQIPYYGLITRRVRYFMLLCFVFFENTLFKIEILSGPLPTMVNWCMYFGTNVMLGTDAEHISLKYYCLR